MSNEPILERYLYCVDANDRISLVTEQWLQFARENSAPHLTKERVIGQLIWDFVTGEETRDLYRNVFTQLRTARTEVVLAFHCDSPTMVREMSLTVRSCADRTIELEGRLHRTEGREPIALLDPTAERSDEWVSICSLCRRVSAGGVWVTVAEAVTRERLFHVIPVPQLRETVCPECQFSATRAGSS